MAILSLTGSIDRAKIARIADGLVVAVAVALPWSTSATSILLVLWLLALIPTLEWTDVRQDILTPAGGLPVLLWALGVIGMAWADVTWAERWGGLDSFFKLLVIPLLFVQFRRPGRGLPVFAGYCFSCVVLLVVSTFAQFVPGFSFIPMHFDNVMVKSAATQSGEFVTCIFGLLFALGEAVERRRWLWAGGMLVVMLGMAVNILYVATGRTALAIIPVLFVIFAAKRFSTKGFVIMLLGAIVVGAAAWYSSPYLRDRTDQIMRDYRNYEATDARNSSGERLEFAKKSIGFIRAAPIIGHGTGSIHAQFVQAAVGDSGAASVASTNPHNQTFAVAIQLGFVGAFVLWAMWAAHLSLFRGTGLAAWVGLVIVVQNIVGSLFNSHLFDFVQGWVYVVGVGVAGGMVLRDRAMKSAAAAAQKP
jgi:O-antigen ligase